MELLLGILGVAGIGGLLGLILKKFLTGKVLGKWGKAIRSFFKGLGIACTLGLSKIPYLKGLWNKVIEPYVIILLRLIINNAIIGFIEGLETDNKSMKDD